MNDPDRTRFLTCLLVLTVLVAFGADAVAQSPAELRRENQALQTQVADLTLQYDAAIARIRELEAEIARLQARLSGTPTPPAGTTAPTGGAGATADASLPTASPRALFAAVAADYADVASSLEAAHPDEDGLSTARRRTLDRWTRGVNRQYRRPVEWHVRVVDGAVPVARGFLLRLQAVDPESKADIGAPFDARVGKSLAGRLQSLDERGQLDDILVLKGTVVPLVRVNPDRTERGAFDNPPFIAPYVEFGLAVEAQTLLPPAAVKGDEAPATKKKEAARSER